MKVANLQNPHNPRFVARLQNPGGTSAEDVVVRHVSNSSFDGALAVVGIQVCGDPEGDRPFRGLQFFDVTDPENPEQLSRWAVPAGSVGCHDVDLLVRDGGKVLAGCANIFAEQINGKDEVDIVDVSRPGHPDKVGGFALGRDLGIDPQTTRQNLGCIPASFAHSVRFTSRTLFASYWDYGTIRFDVGPRGRLTRVNRIDIAPPDEDGDNHSMTLNTDHSVAVINPEDFSPAECGQPYQGWGEAHVYSNTRGDPELLSIFSTRKSRSSRADGFFSIHNTEIARGDQAFSSWYTDGVVWWSLEEPDDPQMQGHFVPPGTEDPTGFFPPVPLVRGVSSTRPAT